MADGIAKSPTGIEGFDDLTLGGLPAGRPTLVCGSAGCGKTLFAATFLTNGARLFGEPGVFVTFEERPADIEANVASLGFGLDELVEQGKVCFEHVAIDPGQLAEIGEFADVHFICVGTPQVKDGGNADLSYVFGAVEALAPHLNRATLIVCRPALLPAATLTMPTIFGLRPWSFNVSSRVRFVPHCGCRMSCGT